MRRHIAFKGMWQPANSPLECSSHKWGKHILSSTDRLFHCFTTLQCNLTHKMLQAEIETQVTLCQSDILTQSHL